MEKFASLPKWGQYLATFIVAGLLVFAVWYLLIKDQIAKRENLNKQVDQLVQDIRQGQEAQKRLDELNRQMEIIMHDLDVFKSIIPLDPQTGTLLRAFQSFARDQSLEISKISPRGLEKRELYTQQPYAIQVTGGYHDIALFFDKLAHMRRIVNVSGLEMSSIRGKGVSLVGAKFDAMVYMQNPEEAPDEAPKGKEKKP
jgi:type IV pilus assembly protein PilO